MDCLAGCIGGAAGVLVSHPFDTIKVRLQTQSLDNVKYRGTLHCAKTILKQESARGFYKGVTSPLLGAAAVNSIIFGVYGAIRQNPENHSLWGEAGAGAVSGAVQSVVASPMELVKTRMQLNESSPAGKGPSAWNVLKSIYLKEGGLRRGVFKGWGTTLCREVPGFALYFATFDYLANKSDGQLGVMEMLMAGGMAGVTSWFFTFPIDVVKTRLQSDVSGKYSGAFDCFRKTLKAEGPKAFSRGLNSTLIRAFPANAATFFVVSAIQGWHKSSIADNDADDKKQFIQQVLGEAEHFQEKIKESTRFALPHYFGYVSLASSCAATSMKHLKSSVEYINFYDMIQHYQPMINSSTKDGLEHINLTKGKFMEPFNYQINDNTMMSSNTLTNTKTSQDYIRSNESPTNNIREKSLSHETSPFPLTEAKIRTSGATSVHSSTTPAPSQHNSHNSNENLNITFSNEQPICTLPTAIPLESKNNDKEDNEIKKKYNYQEFAQRLQRWSEKVLKGEESSSPSNRALTLTDIVEWWIQHNMPTISFCYCSNDSNCVCFD